MMTQFDEVLFTENKGIGFIHLNRPKALNALTSLMAAAIRDKLKSWQRDKGIKAVVVTGEGVRAFCAGGDVLRVIQSYKDGTDEWRDFFRNEYQMNVAIAEFTKPYISFVDGITMGGGVGVSIPGDFWVASENTLFAMPETGLGLFPDVGGSWFLPRLGGEMGMFLALTGARLKTPDLYALGIATHTIGSADTEKTIEALMAADIKDNDDVDKVLKAFHQDPEPAPIMVYADKIDDHFYQSSVENILNSLAQDTSEWAQKQLSILQRHSPTSLKVTFEQLHRGLAVEKFRDSMQMEYCMVNHIMRGHDFAEGVRALLIDKDNSPRWSPATLDAVTPEMVMDHFKQSTDLILDLP